MSSSEYVEQIWAEFRSITSYKNPQKHKKNAELCSEFFFTFFFSYMNTVKKKKNYAEIRKRHIKTNDVSLVIFFTSESILQKVQSLSPFFAFLLFLPQIGTGSRAFYPSSALIYISVLHLLQAVCLHYSPAVTTVVLTLYYTT